MKRLLLVMMGGSLAVTTWKWFYRLASKSHQTNYQDFSSFEYEAPGEDPIEYGQLFSILILSFNRHRPVVNTDCLSGR
jgi:hypothetical protein